MKTVFNLKSLLGLCWAFFCCLYAFPQASIDEAAILSGTNTYKPASSSTPGYWKHTALDANELVTIQMKVSGYVVAFALNENGEEVAVSSISQADANYNYTYFIPVLKGQTVYFRISSWSGEIVFNADMEPNNSIGKTSSADSPLPLLLTEPLLLGDFYSSEWMESTYYVRFVATEDGKLDLYSAQSISNCTVNGEVKYFAYAQGRYKTSVNVQTGQTYDFVIKSYDKVMLQAEITHPTEGSMDIPFIMKEGENSVPAAAGEYWYIFEQNSDLGYVSLSSASTLPDGEVRVYASESDAKYDYARKTSEPGKFTTRFEMSWYGNKIVWYFKVIKKQATDKEDKFTFAIEGYQAGDKESNPILIEQTPAVFVLGSKQSKYYAIEVPANSIKMLSVESATHISTASYTSVIIYEEGKSSEAISGINQVKKAVITGGEPVKYFILWNSYEDSDIEFTVTLDDVADGEIIEKPIILDKAGRVDIEGMGTKYYRYTVSKDCKLTVTVSQSDMEVLFPVSAAEGAGYYGVKQEKNSYSIEAKANMAYIINVLNISDNSYITIEEREFEPGESRSKPLLVDGTYVFDQKIASLWVEYVAKTDGYLDISVDIPYSEESNEFVEFGKKTDESMSRMVQSHYNEDGQLESRYCASVKITKGDSFLVHTNFNASHEGCSIVFTERKALLGEDATNPYLLEKDKKTTIKAVTSGKSAWCMAALTKGTAKLTYSPYWSAVIYKGLENALNDRDGKAVEGRFDSGTSSYNYEINVAEGEEDDYYIAITYCYSDVSVTLTGDNVSADMGKFPSNPILIDEPKEIRPDDVGTLYYSYTPKKDGVLQVTVSSKSMSVEFPVSDNLADGNHEATVYENNYAMAVKARTAYLIKVNGIGKGDSFVISEVESFIGTDRSNPIVVCNGEFTFGEKTANLWFCYAVQSDCYLDVSVNIPFSDKDTEFVEYGENSENVLAKMVERVYQNGEYGNAYQTTILAKAGEVYHIHTVFDRAYKDCKLSFVERESFIGEDISKPFVLELDKIVKTSTSSIGKKVWSKAQLNVGNFILKADEKIECIMYKSYADALNGTNGVQLKPNGDINDVSSAFVFQIDGGESAEVYFVTSSDVYEVALTLSANTTSIHTVEKYGNIEIIDKDGWLHIIGAEDVVRVFSTSGILVAETFARGQEVVLNLSSGYYIVQVGKMQAKVIIR